MIRFLALIFVICFSFCASANYVHQFQLSTTIAKYYQNVDGGYTAVPITGTQNIIVEIVDVDLEQPIWVFSEEQDIDNGSITMVVSDSDIDWVTELETRSLIFRISVLEDQVDIPFEYLPFSVHSDKSYQFKQFNDEDISYIDYDSKSWVINHSTLNAELAVSGSIVVDKLIGSGEGLVNLTGPGFNDGHSLNSENGIYKDVLYVDATGNVGIFTLTPNARLHLKGSVAFQGDILDIDDYSLPTGNLLFWDPNRASFRSGVFNTSLSSSDIGYYSIGFGEDIQASARYSVVLGGEDHSIDSSGKSSVILGGQAHQIFNSYSIAIGGYLSMIFGEWSVLFGGYENTSYGNYQVILGGENNFTKGMHNLVVGSNNFIDSEYSVVIGSQNEVSANRSIVFGNLVNISNAMDYSFVYSNSSSEFSPSSNGQFLINADGGIGINRMPSSDMTLSVSGDLYATQFIGDGQNLYNIQDYDSFWKSISGGIYYLDGNVAIGTTNIMASLTVDGAITLGSSQQLENALTPVNGTLHFDNDSDLLQFYINEWVTVNMQDTDTLITFDDDDIELSVSTIDYLKFVEDLDSVDYIFGSNGILKNGLLEWFSDAGFYAGDFVWFDNQSESRDLEIISMINKVDEGNLYSYKWSGYFIPKDTDEFYFKTVSDELSHVVINDSIIIDNDGVSSEGSIYLQENVAYSIEIYFGEDTGDANMNFYWKGGAQVDYTNDLSSYFYVLLDSDFDISQYGLFYQTLAVNTISISDKGADDENVLRYNGSDWFSYNAKVWTDTDNGLYLLDQDLNVSVSGNSYEYPLVIGTNPDLDGSSLEYPLVMGVTDTLLFSPRDASLMINIDFEDDTKSNYVLNSSSSLISDGYENYGALINVEDDVFKLHFTNQAYTVGDVVQLDTVFNLSVDSLYLDTDSPQATFDTQGSVAFLNTYVDHKNFNDLIGFGHASHLEYDDPYYLYLDDYFELNINSGIDNIAEPIQFLIDGNRKGYFNSLGELIIGDDEARAKVSVFDGGIALNVNGGQFGSASYAGKRFSVFSQSFIDPSIVFEYGNNIIVNNG